MWQDALRVCKDYIPNKLPLLQEEYDREMATVSTKYVDFSELFLCLDLCGISTENYFLTVFSFQLSYC